MRSHPCVLLAALVFGVWLGLGTPGAAATPGPAAPSASRLPTTQPGISASEGVFLVTTTADGSEAIYFIAQNTRHSTLPGDLQRERELNPLWPAWIVDREVVLAFAEAAPVGAARVGLLNASVVADAPGADEAALVMPEPAQVADADAADADAVVADDVPTMAEPSRANDETAADDTPVVADDGPTTVEPSLANDETAAANAPLVADDMPMAEPSLVADDGAATADASPAAVEASGPGEAGVVADDGPTMAEPALVGDDDAGGDDAAASADDAAAAGGAAPGEADASEPMGTDVGDETADREPVAVEGLLYVVRAGDNLTRLSARNGTTVQAIVDANGIRNRNLIYIGQTIIIPVALAAPEPEDEPGVVADQAGVADQPLPSASTPATEARPVPTRDVAAPQESRLPTTQPGLSASEGVFLITTTEDGSTAIYFIAQNTRHSTLPGDLQRERELNPMWPAWTVDREVVLAFAEADPVGAASVGLLGAPVSVGEPTSVYTVRAGDNLTRLSSRYGTSVRAIADANGIRNPNLIYVRQVISIPQPR